MDEAPLIFERLSNARPSLDGTRLAFTIECQGGNAGAISCTFEQIADMVTFLVNVAVIASEQSGLVAETPKSGGETVGEVMPIRGIGFAPGKTALDTIFVVDTSAFPLHFSVPSSELSRMATELGQIVRVLSAGSSKQ